MMRIHLLLIMRIIIVVSAFFSLHSIASEEINPASIESSEFDADFYVKLSGNTTAVLSPGPN